tara:strand:+ start:2592 stop:2939 length:348 start_codon:yes stop_codon:yes gene_type:complete
MKYTFTLIFIIAFLSGCRSLDDHDNTQKNLSIESRIHRNLNKDGSELLEDMQSIIQSGLFIFEVYNIEGALIEVLNNSSDFSNCFIKKFDPCHMNIKPVKIEGKFIIETTADFDL